MANEEPNELSIDTLPSPQSAKQTEEDEELRDSSTPPESTTATTNTPQPGGGFVNATQPETALDLQKFRKAGVKTFTQRCRLFVGNLPSSVTEDELKKLFVRYGEISEVLVSPERGFGFIRLETRSLAEIAKAELDGTMLSNRPLRIRFATHGAALTVRNLSPSVSNELLEQAFLQFGVVERAVVIVDDQGRPTGNGIVEFSNKLSALKALDLCNSGAFLLTMSPRPVVVEPTEQFDEEDGLPEKLLQKSLPYYKERANMPRFAQPGTFDFEFSSRWKALEEIKKLHRDLIGRSIKVAKEKLEAEIEAAKNEHQLMMMRQDLMRRQEELRRLEELKNLELQKRKQLEMRHDGDKCRPDEDMMCHREQLDMKCNPDAFNSFLENRAQDMRMNPMNVRMNKTSSHEAGKMGDSLSPIQSYKMDVSGRGGHLKTADNTVQNEFSDGRPKMAFHGHPDGDSLQHQHQHQQPSPRMVPACSASAALSPTIFTSASPAGDGFDASKNSWCGY